MINRKKRIKDGQGVMIEITVASRSQEVRQRQIEVAIKLIALCYEMKLVYNAETWMNVREEDLLKPIGNEST